MVQVKILMIRREWRRFALSKTTIPDMFQDTETAFASRSDSDLNRAYWLFRMIGMNWLVRISPPFVQAAITLHLPVKGLIKKTIFRHFCGGEDIRECDRTIKKLAEFRVGTILDYSVEGSESESDFDKTLEETLATIRRAKGDSSIPFCVFKPTGISRFGLLEKCDAGIPLDPQEAEEFSRFRHRFERICKEAFENGVPVFIDAEESWIQKTIDDLAVAMMRKFNTRQAIVFNTVQLYRHDRLQYLRTLIEESAKDQFQAGVKLVRGAYMEKERKRAAKLDYASPIQSEKSNTDRDYDLALKACIDHIGHVALCAGTHNEQSSLLLTRLMKDKGIPNNHPHVWFSQLYGMSDHISFNLANAGYNVCKYVPYGPVTAVLPYLIRRAQENTSVKGQTGRELSLIQKEIRRRKG
jgi:proline dehydrogenase